MHEPKGLFADEPARTKRRPLSSAEADELQRKRRGRERRNIRAAAVGSANRKLLLWTLDDHIGAAKAWQLSFAAIAREMNVHRATAYRTANELRELGLISFQPVEGSDRLHWFKINHRNVSNFIDGDARQERRRKRRQAVAPCDTVSHPATVELSHSAKDCRTMRQDCRNMRIETSNISAQEPPLLPQAPPAQPAEEWEEAERRLIDSGVGAPESALERAKGRGCSPAFVLELIDHFEGQPGAWTPGQLWRRVMNAGPGQAVDALWMAPATPKPQARSPAAEATPEAAERERQRIHAEWIRQREAKGLPTTTPNLTGPRTLGTFAEIR